MYEVIVMIQTILTVLMILLTAAVAVLGARYYLHMLQLSSYQFRGYGRFFRAHPRLIGFHAAALALLAISAAAAGVLHIGEDGIRLAAFAPALLIDWAAFFLFRPRQAKKKFVLTTRVWRLIAILALLCAAVVIVPALLAGAGLTGVLYLFLTVLAFLPFILALANLLAQPAERAVRQWYINDARRMLAEHPGLRIIGITGSYGKTSVKHYLTAMLSESFSVLMTPGSYNTPMGVVRTIREQLRPTHEIFVCEMGARHVGDIKEICDIVAPHDGILTAIGDQHLETFFTRENIINTKYELLDAVEHIGKGELPEVASPRGAAFDRAEGCLKFINGDDEILTANRRYPDAVTYGLTEGNSYRGEILAVDASGTAFRVTMPGETAEFLIPLAGRHNVVNVIGAIAVAHELGVPTAKLRMAARRLKTAEHRLEIKKMPYGVLLDDAYNSNPAGAAAALETMAQIAESDAQAGQDGEPMLKILLSPGMVELGEKQDAYNADFGRAAAAVCDLILTVGHTNREAIRRGAAEAGFPADRIIACDGVQEAMNLANAREPGRRRVLLIENDLTDNY